MKENPSKPENKGRLIVILVALVLLFVLIAGLAVIFGNTTKQTYTSTDPALSFSYPKGWYVEQDSEEFFIAQKDFNDESVAHFMELYVYESIDFDDEELEAIETQQCQEYAEIFGYTAYTIEEDEMRLQSSDKFESKNAKGCVFDFQISTDGEIGYQKDYYLVRGDQVFNAIISGDELNDSTTINQFVEIVKSLQSE